MELRPECPCLAIQTCFSKDVLSDIKKSIFGSYLGPGKEGTCFKECPASWQLPLHAGDIKDVAD